MAKLSTTDKLNATIGWFIFALLWVIPVSSTFRILDVFNGVGWGWKLLGWSLFLTFLFLATKGYSNDQKAKPWLGCVIAACTCLVLSYLSFYAFSQ